MSIEPGPIKTSASTDATQDDDLSASTPEMSDATTHGIRIGATAFYLPDESDGDEGKHVFGYRIVIHNTTDQTVQLTHRRWHVIDGNGNDREVWGEGVVGQQPTLEPGKAFKYTSWAPLETPWGTMEGVYTFRDEQGETFDARIERFYLTPAQEDKSVQDLTDLTVL